MAIEYDFLPIHQRECIKVDFDIDEDIAGWTLRLSLMTLGGTELVGKTIGSGITLTSAAAGTGRGIFTSDDTDRTRATYRWSLARVDTGEEVVLGYGLVPIILPGVVLS